MQTENLLLIRDLNAPNVNWDDMSTSCHHATSFPMHLRRGIGSGAWIAYSRCGRIKIMYRGEKFLG